jgi:hypothetical protein
VGPIGYDFAINGYRVNLAKIALAVKLRHCHAHLRAGRSRARQFGALNGKAIVAGDEPVIARSGIALGVCRPETRERQNNQDSSVCE